jgi:hypothetical protein
VIQVLLMDDYSEITELILRQAYVEAIYWENEWEYERLTQRYWEHLIYEVSESGSIDYLLEKHPMHGSKYFLIISCLCTPQNANGNCNF